VRTNFKDCKIVAFVRRANLDVLWAREPNTVMVNLGEAVRMEKFTSQLGLPSVTPPMGPYPLRDEFGMLAALALSWSAHSRKEYIQNTCSGGLFEKQCQQSRTSPKLEFRDLGIPWEHTNGTGLGS
jgi:hypothetical protein